MADMLPRQLHRRPGRPQRSRIYAPFVRYSATEAAPGTRPIWLYLRLSKAAGDEHDAIERHRIDLIRMLTDSGGWTVMGEYIDNDSASVSAVRTRRGWQALNTAIDDGDVQALAFWKLDRLSRVAVDVITFIATCRANGVELTSFSEGPTELNSVSTGAKLVTGIRALVAEGETDTMSERQRAAKRHLAEAGFHHGGQVPFGWQVGPSQVDSQGRSGKRLMPHPVEFPALKLAVEMALNGESLTAIARRWQDQRGIVTEDGRPVYVASILRSLRSPRLMGYRMRNVPDHRRGVKVQLIDYVARDATGEPVTSHEAVCDKPTWLRLQRTLDDARNSKVRTPWGQHEWILSGAIYCSTCDYPMHGHAKGDKKAGEWITRYVYACQSNRRVRAGTCLEPATIAQHLVEGYTRGWLEEHVTDEALAQARARRNATARHDEDLAGALAEAKLERDALLAEQGKPQWRGARVSILLGMVAEAQSRVDAAEHQLALVAMLDDLPSSCSDLGRRWGSLSLIEKRQIVRQAIARIAVAPGRGSPSVRIDVAPRF